MAIKWQRVASIIVSCTGMAMASGCTSPSIECRGNGDCRQPDQYCTLNLCVSVVCKDQSECFEGRKCWNNKCVESICAEPNNGCDNATCQEPTLEDFKASGKPTCKCNEGFSPIDGICVSNDDCKANEDICKLSEHFRCNDSTRRCECDSAAGYVLDGKKCVQAKDCTEEQKSTCTAPNSTCQNIEGEIKCSCPAGYEGDGKKGCVSRDLRNNPFQWPNAVGESERVGTTERPINRDNKDDEYIALGDDSVVDTRTSLVWQKKPVACGVGESKCDEENYALGTWTWATAKDTTGKFKVCPDGWHVPAKNELESLLVKKIDDANYYLNGVFLGTRGWYWTQAPYAGSPGSAWVVGFNSGYTSYGIDTANALRVRCVR